MNIKLPRNITVEQITNSSEVSDELCEGYTVAYLGCDGRSCTDCALDNNDNRDLYLAQNKKIESEEKELINMKDTYEDGVGNIIRILCIDGEDLSFPVIALLQGLPLRYTSSGSSANEPKSIRDLVKVDPYKDFKVDDKFIVWDDPNDRLNRHFSHLDKGMVKFFNEGKTSFSNNGLTRGWKHFEKV